MPSAAELTGMGLHNLGQERSLLLNEIVANEYAHINDEYTPWHSHKNGLLDDEALIPSVTVGALGVFCFASRHGAESAKKWNFKNVTKKKMCSWMRCFVARGFDDLVWDLQGAYGAQIIAYFSSPGINVEGREALHYLIQCMHEYGHKNRIGTTYRVWLQNLETAGGATRNRNRR